MSDYVLFVWCSFAQSVHPPNWNIYNNYYCNCNVSRLLLVNFTSIALFKFDKKRKYNSAVEARCANVYKRRLIIRSKIL